MLIIHTRSTRKAGGGRGGSDASDRTLCTHGGIAKKAGIPCVQCVMWPSSSRPQLEYDGGDHKTSIYGSCVVSFRTGIFLQD